MNIREDFKKHYVEFNSLAEFYDYIMNTPFNESFKDPFYQQSVKGRYNFTQTESFEEAVNLFKTGWQDMSEKLTKMLKASTGKMEKVMVSRNVADVQGYHPIVPLYLNGIPNNMISRKLQPVKSKVITLNKSIAYSAIITSETIVEESIKALSIIKKLESQNYRCNLNLVFGSYVRSDGEYVVKIRLKSANERLNINKLSFPLVHPSMLRRLFFRFIEVFPGVPTSFRWGYGAPVDLKNVYPGDIFLPPFINKDINKISSMEDLNNLGFS